MGLRLLQSFVSSVPILWCSSMLLLLYQASHKTALASPRLGGNATDHLALLSFKAQITHDPMLITSLWNDSLHFCQWKGVLCGRRHLRVTGLNLQSSNLAGSISPAIGNLSFLRIVNLTNNSFQGEIPHEMGRLFRLRVLDLGINLLEGQIPVNLSHCSNVRFLGLHQNKFIGNLPKELGSLSQLEALNIGSNNLTGVIPASFGNLSSLELLSARENMLEGNIPGSLGSLKSLVVLRLTTNQLSGDVPVHGVFKNASAVSISRNNKLCGGIPAFKLPACPLDEPRKKKMSLGPALIIPIACGISGIILASTILILCLVTKMRKQPFVTSSLMDSPRKISYGKLLKATNGFSSANLIGTGRFGSVYKGILHPSDQKAIAVKVLHQQSREAIKSFMDECRALRNTRHRNLVKIVSVCASIDFQGNEFKAIVYEFMENRSLESWLHPVFPPTGDDQEQPRSLSLLQRLNIAIDVAFALDYLHNHCHIPVVHCDIKPSNILLDGDMTAHVGDFGIARLLQQRDISEVSGRQTNSVVLRGSIGYVAPEYGMGAEVSTSGDMYSYGILLLEMFTGKRPTDGMFKDGLNLHKLANMALSENVIEIVDQKQLEEEKGTRTNSRTPMTIEKNHECLFLILKIGIACSEESPRDRMTIVDASRELFLIKTSYW
ncbi:probable LRR receptor-like serine/threonine-protein kinase At3g47570 isoform X2 [Actinidia eriantha]|uniref:probable LRR receptor-like serine/threonine-protein kinase At3g47570 isoform X2 n=1 Tax=Actinidia eriantha TaxID=165200 RepID=UPI00258D993B|nr:probable LRR receptor-like serine/threonine-protein kinase At3g47570 isoform X2 [Actinidia eriantha]